MPHAPEGGFFHAQTPNTVVPGIRQEHGCSLQAWLTGMCINGILANRALIKNRGEIVEAEAMAVAVADSIIVDLDL